MRIARVRSHLVVIAIAALLATVSWPASAARAADDSNIPGVPLPGPVVTGTLGGPVYDRVFAIDVPADRIVLLALSGDPGTDFDMYLFDSSATTVYSTQGQVAASTSSTSTESITYPTIGGGRFYIDLNGATNAEGNFRLTMRIAADTTAPGATIRLDDGAPATSDSAIRVTVVATDDLSGVTDMQFSLDGRNWDAWRTYAPVTLWSFPPVDGERTLSARVRDRSGNVSAITTASIVIDSASPTVISRTPGPDTETTSVRPTFRVVFSESIDPQSWTALGLVLQAADGSTVRGEYRYDDAAKAGLFTPSDELVPGAVYVATLGAIVDLAGNPVAPIGTWVVRPLRSASAALSATPASVAYGDVTTLRGRIDLPVQGVVTVERSVAGGSWGLLTSVHPDAAGDFSVRTQPSATTRYRVRVPATLTQSSSVSAELGVVVRRSLTLTGSGSTATRTAGRGSTVSLHATLGPVSPDAVVTFTIYRMNPVSKRYVAVSSFRRTSVRGAATASWRPTGAGQYYIRLTVPAAGGFASGVSSAYRWTIS